MIGGCGLRVRQVSGLGAELRLHSMVCLGCGCCLLRVAVVAIVDCGGFVHLGLGVWCSGGLWIQGEGGVAWCLSVGAGGYHGNKVT